ncbi:hypothetical protein BC834DRAFT_973148 [Gloeopeniophorella convolvens]|nr:hypothetical protein BC834DRAFT_973148 [Gloeopeniophorella convolvens]
MYLEKARKEDDRMAENWKGDVDGTLVFTDLFSTTVAMFIGISLPNLTQHSRMAPMVQLPSTFPDPSSFSSLSSAVWVNVLPFPSLVISLTCALLATLL